MESRSAQDSNAAHPLGFLAGGGEMGHLIRSMDWSATPLGPVESWPQSLRTTINICLASDLPICVIWGPGLVQIYNDGYRVICGGKHPRSMGQNFPECWKEAWPVIGEAHDSALAGDTAFLQSQHIFLERHGYLEECFFTFSFSPIRDEAGRVGGLFHPVIEMTSKMLGERRTRALRDLAARTSTAKSVNEALALSAETLAEYGLDLPFVLFYAIDPKGHQAQLVGTTGLKADPVASPSTVDLGAVDQTVWPLAEVVRLGSVVQVDDIGRRIGQAQSGPYPEPANTALALPIIPPGANRPTAVFIAGISPRLPMNEAYRSFYDLLASGVTTAVANARAYEEERRRAEALAELDRAKTAFFSNVSHEFRTPLTLMLGPVEDLLAGSSTNLSPVARHELEVVNRNGLRLLRLVNTLLDFSRIEAGRVQAVFEPTDLGTFTADLASSFRSACERTGLALAVHCEALDESVFVDRDMWEKIVLNLMSNAFKYTFSGGIFVTLRRASGHAELSIRDTGSGIPAESMPRLFERFYRVENAEGRTHEGSGIGLALVSELVKLHGGSVRVESAVGAGTTFTVAVPLGADHLPAQQIGGKRQGVSTSTGARAFVEEALRWLPDEQQQPPSLAELPHDDGVSIPAPAAAGPLPRVLVADDNADMRQYVARLLGERYHVETARDGAIALAAALAAPPDLVLTDVMMPGMSGFELLQALRTDSRTAAVPVIMLSARAGEESRVEGMDAGADDYLVKPFSARELLARVKAHLDIARVRRQSLEQLRDADRKKDEFLATLAHELRNPLAPIRNSLHLLRLGQSDAEANGQVLEIMERQIKHMVRLVDDLLEVSRITRGKLELRKDRVELAAVVRGAVETSQPLIEAASHQLAISLPSEPLSLEADAVRISQVLANLLNNAAKYMDPGGQIFLTARREGNEIVISVKDTGVGISAEMLPRVFDMFLQVPSAVGRARTGLGIGLALARNLVELHGGSLVGHSRGLGHGSEFVIRLPLAPPSAGAANVAQRPPRKATLAGQRIVVADDNRDAANSLGRLLRVLGAEVQIVYDGAAALAALAQWPAAIVLLDLGMPGMDGYEIARRIREQPELSAVAIIALTGWGQEEDRRRTEEAGFDHHLTKPADVAALQALLTSLRTPEERAKVRHAR